MGFKRKIKSGCRNLVKNFYPAGLWAGLALTLFFSMIARAGESSPDLSMMVRDTQKVSNENHDLTIVWWIPTDFWKASLAASGTLTRSAQEKFLEVVKPYTLVAVVHGKIGVTGAINYEDAVATRGKLTIVDAKNKSYKPISPGDYSADLQNFLDLMSPMLVNMLGPMGKNFNFYAFDAKTADGSLIADAKGKGKFAVLLGENKFEWRLPVDCFVAKKTCPKCNETLSGAFNYCPYDGTILAK